MEKDNYYLLENFKGPIDLLFFLIQRDEINLFDIPLKSLTQQHLSNYHDLENGTDFLFFASFLLLLKSRRLLNPKAEVGDEGEITPELFEYLLEYEKFREMAQLLEKKEEKEKAFYSREIKEEKSSSPYDLNQVDLKELGRLLTELLEKKRKKTAFIEEDKWPIATKLKELENILAQKKEHSFVSLFEKASCKEEIIVIFLALLELIRQKKALFIKDKRVIQAL